MNRSINSPTSHYALTAFMAILLTLVACQEQSSRPEATGTTTEEKTNPSIVFIYADTIVAKYNVFLDKGAELAKREQEENAKLQEKGRAIEQEVRAIQSKVQQGLLAPNQIAREEQRIGQKQQELMMEREQITQELMMESQKLNQELEEKLTKILQDLQAERGYDFILSYGAGTAVMMVNDELDITEEVLARLNADSTTTSPEQ